MSLNESIIEGIGNELLFVLTFVGTVLFLILAWLSTRVNWQLLPVRITLLHHAPEVERSTTPEASAHPDAYSSARVEPQSESISDHEPTESSGSSEEDESSNEMVIRQRRDNTDESSERTEISSSNSEVKSNINITENEASVFRSKGHLVLKLQYLDDRSRFVHAAPNMSISRFKRKHFPDELINQNKNVRLIFQGRELIEFRSEDVSDPHSSRRKAQRLCDYNVTDGSTIHCLITAPISPPFMNRSSSSRPGVETPRGYNIPPTSNDSMLTEFDMGTRLMKPLFAFLLLFTWFFRIVYRQYFNSISTFALVALTVFFCGAVFTVSLVNLMSVFASLLGISTSDNNVLTFVEQSNNDENGTSRPSELQVVTFTMVRRQHSHSSNNDTLVASTTNNTAVTTTTNMTTPSPNSPDNQSQSNLDS